MPDRRREANLLPRLGLRRTGTWRCEHCGRTFDAARSRPDPTMEDADLCRACVNALYREDG